MKLKWAGLAGLSFLFGCVRLGYDVQRPPDAGSGVLGMDAGLADAGSWQDAAHGDAGQSTYTQDASTPSRDAEVADAGDLHDSGVPRDAVAPHDAAVLQDAGTPHDAGAPVSTDAGSADAAMSGMDCGVMIVGNDYIGGGHFHGILKLQNIGTTTYTLQTIAFDIPATFHCDDVATWPGKRWTLQTIAEHCIYTRTSPTTIAAGVTLTFDWSSGYPDNIPAPAAKNVSVDNCQPRY